MRDGKPVPPSFAGQLQTSIERGDLEVFAARMEERLVGTAVLAFRLNVCVGTLFASIEDLYVKPDNEAPGRWTGAARGDRGPVQGARRLLR